MNAETRAAIKAAAEARQESDAHPAWPEWRRDSAELAHIAAATPANVLALVADSERAERLGAALEAILIPNIGGERYIRKVARAALAGEPS